MKFTTLAARFVKPLSKQEDARRREFILNVLLLSVITLLTLATVSSVIAALPSTAVETAHDSMSLVELLSVLGFYILLYVLSRKGYAKIASYIFVALLFLFTLHIALRWGPDVPSAILLYGLTIAITGVLITSRWAFIVAVAFGVLIPYINYLQIVHLISIDSYWRAEAFGLDDAFVVSLILIIIATVSWLSNREMEQSLIRARKSESELKYERDMLEVRVKERTEELRKVELERISQSYKFIEFGRIASGFFHDLTNPITSISLTIENIARSEDSQDADSIEELYEDIARVRKTTRHMQNLLSTMRRHLAHETASEIFSLVRSAEDVVSMLNAYARAHEIDVELLADEDIEIVGNYVAFTQILTNLISNAIESFADKAASDERKIVISISQEGSDVFIVVRDTGIGIASDLLQSVFEPFVSTKSSKGGLGIGLSLVKQLVEREFNGSISVASVVGEGTTFTIQFPIREP